MSKCNFSCKAPGAQVVEWVFYQSQCWRINPWSCSPGFSGLCGRSLGEILNPELPQLHLAVWVCDKKTDHYMHHHFTEQPKRRRIQSSHSHSLWWMHWRAAWGIWQAHSKIQTFLCEMWKAQCSAGLVLISTVLNVFSSNWHNLLKAKVHFYVSYCDSAYTVYCEGLSSVYFRLRAPVHLWASTVSVRSPAE